MDSRKYRDIVTIQQPKPTAVAGDHGHVDLTDDANWVEVCPRRAEVVVTGTRETYVGESVITRTSYDVTLRRDELVKTITTQMRVIWDGQTLDIEGTRVSEDRRERILMCVEAGS